MPLIKSQRYISILFTVARLRRFMLPGQLPWIHLRYTNEEIPTYLGLQSGEKYASNKKIKILNKLRVGFFLRTFPSDK